MDDDSHMTSHSVSPMTDTSANHGGDSFQRIEVITGVARRRRWSSDDKARIVAESLAPGANVLSVCRRYRLNPNQLYGWRRQFRVDVGAVCAHRSGGLAASRTAEPEFTPVVLQDAAQPSSLPGTRAGTIEVAVGGMIVRLDGPVDGARLRQVLDVVRRLG